MGNFEKLSVVVIVVIIVMILVVALYTWTDSPQSGTTVVEKPAASGVMDPMSPAFTPVMALPPAVGPSAKPELAGGARSVQDPLHPSSLAVVPPFDPLRPGELGTTPPAEEPKAEAKTHKVVAGDTLGKISTQYYHSSKHVSEIQKANPDVNALALRPGMILVIPALADAKAEKPTKDAGGEGKDVIKAVESPKAVAKLQAGDLYTVRKGDKLPEIARRTYGSIDRWPDVWLENYDKIADPDVLIPGTRLKLPK